MTQIVDELKELIVVISFPFTFLFPFHYADVQYNSEEETHHLTLHY